MSRNRPDEDLRSLGEFLRNRVAPDESRRVAAAAVRRRRPQRSRTWVGVVVGTAVFAIANVALAQASESAIPGELLYPLDRAYEWIGGRFQPQDLGPERVSEAMQLVEAGDTDRALSLVSEILAMGAVDSNLEENVNRLRGSGNSQDVRTEVRQLVAAAFKVHEAAQSGNHDALEAALAEVKAEAADIAETAGNGQPVGTDNPSVTAPGQADPNDNPAATAPGQVDDPSGSPSDTAPGQNQNQTDPPRGSGNNRGQNRGEASTNP